MKKQEFHEQFDRITGDKKTENRSFGLLFSIVFALVACYPILHEEPIRAWALLVSALFFLFAFFLPDYLSMPNYLWQKIGELLGKITTPIVMGILFYLIITPFAFFSRKKVRNESVQLNFDKSLTSYWIQREPSNHASMKQQF